MDGTNGLSASDIALLGNGGGMNGMNGFFWVFALLILAGGGFGGFNRGGEFGQYATAASQQEILFGQKFSALDNKMDRLGNGIADATYALNNSITGEGRAVQTQLANCCCDNQRNIDALRYDMAQQFSVANATTNAQTQKILDVLAQNKIDTLQAQVNELKTQNMFCGIPRINPYGFSVVPTMGGCPCANM